jgi:hypothetical protein
MTARKKKRKEEKERRKRKQGRTKKRRIGNKRALMKVRGKKEKEGRKEGRKSKAHKEKRCTTNNTICPLKSKEDNFFAFSQSSRGRPTNRPARPSGRRRSRPP